jgi:hypothetical protein
MANNYGPITTPGQTRERIWRIGGENPNPYERHGSTPSIVFHEEQAIGTVNEIPDAPGVLIERSLGRTRDITMPFDPDRVVAIRNPQTDALGGAFAGLPDELTLAQCYAVLYSLGRQAQTDADGPATSGDDEVGEEQAED